MTQDQETREKILDAARDVFQRRGTSGARMQEIADAAGVNKALLHYYYGSKEQLAADVFRRSAEQLVPPVLQTFLSDATLEQKVRRVVDIYYDVLPRAPELPGYVLSEMHFHPERIQELLFSTVDDDAFPQNLFDALDRQIDRAVAKGELRPITARQLVVNVIALCVFPFAARPMFTMLFGGRENFDDFIHERADVLADFILGALRP